jgi:diacylglycerol diphosphate phosphatase / phosphatidate phosphatase
MNFVYALFIPLGIMILYNLVARSSVQKHEATYLSFAIALVLTSFLTETIKNAVGRPRPDLISRCKPGSSTLPDTLVMIDVCTETNHHKLHDGWRSFPSGHASFSFAGLGFLSLFLAGQLHIFRYQGGGRDLGRALICLAPLVGAGLIAISRCEDYRHDVYDVCFGAALGYTVGYWSYRRHWPSLTSKDCEEPHPWTLVSETRPGWNRLRDEEEGRILERDVGLEMFDLDRDQR